MINVMLVDDQEMIRAGLRSILGKQEGLKVVCEVGDGMDVADLIEKNIVDVVLMDLRMPGIDGVEATRRIRAAHSAEKVKIIVLTTFDEEKNVLAALRAGANGFLSKGVGPAELAGSIREVVAGGGALSAAAAAALIQNVAEERKPVVDDSMVDRFSALTPRERDVVAAIATGLDNAQIAAQMFVSPFTVKTHANRAMAKLGARDRAQLVTFAYQAGMF
ncbi:response regulator transcription factor [Microbacterium sp.]|uniref:response regulator transcription factor n=1 Tax=Microbacterium sp. TaxID=51671 RepID=UPI002736FD47|nr:response regulator transcription factor [Microbacterium sp.]MDP3951679.1 response regulator transcription factor [Microbacterium sp.]